MADMPGAFYEAFMAKRHDNGCGAWHDDYVGRRERARASACGRLASWCAQRTANNGTARIFRAGAAARRTTMKLSARNMLKGKIVEVTKGTTTAHVKIDVGGQIVTSAITNEAVDALKLAKGQDAYAVIKASDVMVAID
jgi:molybdopterin-binding protein